MSLSKTVALSLAAILFSAVSVQAATAAKKPAHHAMPMKHASKAAPDADHSADSLNAQSLTKAQAPK